MKFLARFTIFSILLGSGLALYSMEPDGFRSGSYVIGSLGSLSLTDLANAASQEEFRASIWYKAKYASCDEMAEYLTIYPSSINRRDAEGKTPLMHAAHKGRIDMVNFLIKKGADRELQDTSGRSALYYAILYTRKNNDLLGTLITEKTIAQVDITGHTPLMHALGFSDEQAFEYLLEHGADPNVMRVEGDGARTENVLLTAAQETDEDFVRIILDNSSININAQAEEDGETALHRALADDISDLYEDIREIGVDTGKSEHEIVQRQRDRIDQSARIVTMLIDSGASLQAKTHEERTPLHYAASNLRLPELVILLDSYKKQGICTNPRDTSGETPLDLARIEYGDEETANAMRYTRDQVLKVLQASDEEFKDIRKEYHVDEFKEQVNAARKRALAEKYNLRKVSSVEPLTEDDRKWLPAKSPRLDSHIHARQITGRFEKRRRLNNE